MLFNKVAQKKEEIKTSTSTVADVTPSAQAVEEHKSDFAESADVVEKLRAGRNISDIPLDDPYWESLNAHQRAHGAHAIRVDVLPDQEKINALAKKGIVAEKV